MTTKLGNCPATPCLTSAKKYSKKVSPSYDMNHPAIWSYLVVTVYAGWWFQPLRKILVSWDDYSQYMKIWKN